MDGWTDRRMDGQLAFVSLSIHYADVCAKDAGVRKTRSSGGCFRGMGKYVGVVPDVYQFPPFSSLFQWVPYMSDYFYALVLFLVPGCFHVSTGRSSGLQVPHSSSGH